MLTNGGINSSFLDITREVCPLTFVKTKLSLEKLSVGDILEVRLRAGEPLINVPKSVRDEGHEIVSIVEERDEKGAPAQIFTITICKR
ncbi:MAG: sulfurtransferase TusA family protein [Pseudomonadota bacterium]